jgi:hypothetical protein
MHLSKQTLEKTEEAIKKGVEIKGQFCYLETSSSCQIAQNL